MTRTENDLRDALRELEQRADRKGAPFTFDSILSARSENQLYRDVAPRRTTRWLPPIAAAAVVAVTAVTAVALSAQHHGSPRPGEHPAASPSTSSQTAAPRTPTPTHSPSARPSVTTSAAAILHDAAARLDAAPTWSPPAPNQFFYVRTTQATTWTSVSGTQAGDGRAANGTTIWVPGCDHGRIVSAGESGSCTVNDVSHYLGDAPTTPQAWDAYLERMAPGAKAANAQGKIIAQVLHQDLIAPKAAAALLRYTATCPGLHTLAIQPVDSETLIGVTCTSMTNGSYGLVFRASSHAFAGFTVVTGTGAQNGPAELIRQTGIVRAVGRTP